MKPHTRLALIPAAAILFITPFQAAEIKVDLGAEKIGAEPKTFQPIVGTWLVVEDGKDKVIMVDGRPWMAAQSNPTTLLAEKARTFYGASHEDFIDQVKQFAYYPIAVMTKLDNFSDGAISVKFKTVNGKLDRCSGILFNVKPNGDWLSVRFNDTENNIVLWRFHDGIRKSVKRTPEGKFPLDRAQWHELKMAVQSTDFKAWIDNQLALEYTLPEPVSGKVGLWSKTDSTSYFKDYVVSPQ
jgi:3-keto-disaccharide hydrolase